MSLAVKWAQLGEKGPVGPADTVGAQSPHRAETLGLGERGGPGEGPAGPQALHCTTGMGPTPPARLCRRPHSLPGTPALRLCPPAGCQHLFLQTSRACHQPRGGHTSQASAGLCGLSHGGPAGTAQADHPPVRPGRWAEGPGEGGGGHGVRQQSQFSSWVQTVWTGWGWGSREGRQDPRPPAGPAPPPGRSFCPLELGPHTRRPASTPLQATQLALRAELCPLWGDVLGGWLPLWACFLRSPEVPPG